MGNSTRTASLTSSIASKPLHSGWHTVFILALIAVIFAVYSGNLDGPFIFDDSRIQNNPQLHITNLSPITLFKAGFESSPKTRPVAYISFALNYFFHGYDTLGYHLVNIIIHALTAVFLYLFIRVTLGLPCLAEQYGDFILLPFAAALVWAVHPLQTQSVSYIIQRMNAMAAMFYILSLLLYTRARLAESSGKKWTLFLGSGVSGFLALGSKETAATLPFFIFLYEWYFFQDLDLKWLRKKIFPLLVLGTVAVLLTLLYLGFNPLQSIQATYSSREFTLMQRVLTEFRVVVFYISLLLFPYPGRLNLDHSVTLSTGFFSPVSTAISLLVLLFLFFAAIAGARKYRLVSFGILWFLGNLLIESSVIGLEIIFEHRNYLPSMLLVLLILVAVFSTIRNVKILGGFLCLLMLIISFWTFERNRVWNDRISLWGDSVAKSPAKARPHNNLGVALKDQGRVEEAVTHFNKTIQLDPQFTEAYNNLANAYILQGQIDKALINYRIALDIDPNNPTLHTNLANALVKRWELEEALLHYGQALRLDPGNQETRLNYLSTQRMLEARRLKSRQ